MAVTGIARVVTVTIPGRPPGANVLGKMTRWTIRTERAKWREIAYLYGLDAVRGVDYPRAFRRASVGVLWRCRVRRKRDYDNLVSGLKPILDGLVDAGILVDDSTDCLTMLGPLRVEVGAELDETILTVTEVEG